MPMLLVETTVGVSTLLNTTQVVSLQEDVDSGLTNITTSLGETYTVNSPFWHIHNLLAECALPVIDARIGEGEAS